MTSKAIGLFLSKASVRVELLVFFRFSVAAVVLTSPQVGERLRPLPVSLHFPVFTSPYSFHQFLYYLLCSADYSTSSLLSKHVTFSVSL